MGGKTWSAEEEQIFWVKLMPHSPKRLGSDLSNKEKSWTWVGQQMKKAMGEKARRDYTELCVFEHYFQNTYLGRFSPKVGRLPMKYYRAEMASKRKKEAEKAKKEKEAKEAKESEDADADESKGSLVDESKGAMDSPVEVDSAGEQDSPIELDCQYPTHLTVLPYHGGHPIPRFTAVPSAPPSFGLPGSMPPPAQYYFHQFSANHGRLTNTGGAEEDRLSQAPASWVDAQIAAPPRGSDYGYGYGYRH